MSTKIKLKPMLWQKAPPLKRIKPSGKNITASEARSYWENKLKNLRKNPTKNAAQIQDILDLLKMSE